MAHKEHVRLGYIIHFDDCSIRERVDLPDETIRIDFDQVRDRFWGEGCLPVRCVPPRFPLTVSDAPHSR